jgi:hypothetical protein
MLAREYDGMNRIHGDGELLLTVSLEYLSSLQEGLSAGIPAHVNGPHPETCIWISDDHRLKT